MAIRRRASDGRQRRGSADRRELEEKRLPRALLFQCAEGDGSKGAGHRREVAGSICRHSPAPLKRAKKSRPFLFLELKTMRVAVGGILHETNVFATTPTTLESFRGGSPDTAFDKPESTLKAKRGT